MLMLTFMFIEKYLTKDETLTRCVKKLLHSQLFRNNKAYVRRKFISLLVEKDDFNLSQTIFIGAFLLIDGRAHSSTLEMMQEESAMTCIIENLWHRKDDSLILHRILLELLYEMCKVQKLALQDLKILKQEFITYLFTAIEEREDYDHDPYSYAILKVLLALNEQYMIANYDLSQKHDADDTTPADQDTSGSSSQEVEKQPSEISESLGNPVFETLIKNQENFSLFGESIVFLLNRSPDTCLQLMALKFLYLIFTNPGTCSYLYVNDLKVIVDVFIRELYNLSTEEERLRHTYLRVLHPLLLYTELRYDAYKRAELCSLLRDMAEISNNPVFEISETTQRLANRCLLVDWLRYHCVLTPQERGLCILADLEISDNTESKNDGSKSNSRPTSPAASTSTLSTDETPNLSPCQSNRELSPTFPTQPHYITVTLADTPGSSKASSVETFINTPPPPPPPRIHRKHDSKSKPRHHRRLRPPPVPARRKSMPPPLPLPRKRAGSVLGMSIRSTSEIDLATFALDKPKRKEESSTNVSNANSPCPSETDLFPLPVRKPPPPRPRLKPSKTCC